MAENTVVWLKSLKMYWDLFDGLTYCLSWQMFQVHLLSRMFCTCLLALVGLCIVQLLFPLWSLPSCFINYWKWVLTFPTIVVELPISPFTSVNVCFMYSGALLLGAHMFMLVISSWWVDFYYCKMSFLSQVTIFILKSILPAISLAMFQVCLSLFCFVTVCMLYLFPSL